MGCPGGGFAHALDRSFRSAAWTRGFLAQRVYLPPMRTWLLAHDVLLPGVEIQSHVSLALQTRGKGSGRWVRHRTMRGIRSKQHTSVPRCFRERVAPDGFTVGLNLAGPVRTLVALWEWPMTAHVLRNSCLFKIRSIVSTCLSLPA
jgi:hypothetical protein